MNFHFKKTPFFLVTLLPLLVLLFTAIISAIDFAYSIHIITFVLFYFGFGSHTLVHGLLPALYLGNHVVPGMENWVSCMQSI